MNLTGFFINKILENLLNEEWMPIAGYEGLYEISNYSRIKSTKFKLHRIMNPNGKVSPKKRYLACRLFDRQGKPKIVTNHRIAAMHFVPNPNPEIFTDVNHKDGDRDNNHISNFEWCTHRENILHGGLATREGKSSRFKGVSRHNIGNGGRTFRWAIYKDKKHIRKFGFTTEEAAFEDLKKYCQDNGLGTKYLE